MVDIAVEGGTKVIEHPVYKFKKLNYKYLL